MVQDECAKLQQLTDDSCGIHNLGVPACNNDCWQPPPQIVPDSRYTSAAKCPMQQHTTIISDAQCEALAA
jgi:hypothetical protein